MNGSLKVLSPLLLTLKVPGVATLVALLTGVAIAFLLARCLPKKENRTLRPDFP